jgi:RHS repeat-associated protein
MNTSKRIRQIIILAVFALAALSAAGADTAGERYIVILKSRSGPAPDVARLGGTITFRQDEQVNVTLPREALAALRADPLVRYVQAVAGDAPLIGEPEEPTPGTPRRLVPHAMAGNQSWSRSYSYDDAGNIINIGSQEFVYDELGRLKEMATSGTMTEQYGYDRYGNQTSRNSGGVLQQIDTDTATNRLSTGYTYDAAGNVKTGDGYTLSYDALGQAATKTYTATNTFNETYIYTAGDERIGVQTSNSTETSSWWYWSVRDEGGKVLRQYRSSALDPTQTALWIEDYVYRDGLLVGAERPPTLGGRRHFHLDHLGSPRLITSNDGQIVSTHDYLPFGGETTSVWQEEYAGFDREDPMKFTGHERDYAGGFGREDGHAIDYMHARYYTATLGRFFSVDPVLGKAEQPQSWNRYLYVSNSPLTRIDPTGRETRLVDVSRQSSIERLAPDSDEDGGADGSGGGSAKTPGTVAIGVGVSGNAVGATGEASLSLTTDDCDAGLMFSYGTGFTSDPLIGASGGVFISASNAPNIHVLTGKGTAGGIIAGADYAGAIEVFHGPNGAGSKSVYTGATVLVGTGVKAPSGYAVVTNTIMITTWSQLSTGFRSGFDRWIREAETTIRSIGQ